MGFASIAAARLTRRRDKGRGREERGGNLRSVSRLKRKLFGSSLDGSGDEDEDERAAAGTRESKRGGARAPLNIAGSKDNPAKRSASPRAMLGVAGRAWV